MKNIFQNIGYILIQFCLFVFLSEGCLDLQNSPINFRHALLDESLSIFEIEDSQCLDLRLKYAKGFLTLEKQCNNQVYLNFQDNRYILNRIALKSSSEHTLGSKLFDGELQLYHIDTKTNKELVLVVWLELGQNVARNLFLEASLAAVNGDDQHQSNHNSYGLYHQVLYGGDLSYLTYEAHISINRCSEDSKAIWLVKLSPLPVQKDQFAQLLTALKKTSQPNDEGIAADEPRVQSELLSETKVGLFLHTPRTPPVAFSSDGTSQCHLIQGTFAIVMQCLLGVIAMSSLVIKRFTEKPRRSWLVWSFDVSKQGMGALFIHIWNMSFAVVLGNAMSGESGPSPGSDECALYAMNLTLDIFVGTFWLYVLVQVQTKLANRFEWENLKRFGDYGEPPNITIYLDQLWSYFFVILAMKVIMSSFILSWRKHLNSFYSGIFAPLQENPHLELIIVMIILPGCLNAFAYWIIDNFLKKSEPGKPVLSLH